MMVNQYWSELIRNCPVDVNLIHRKYLEFCSTIPQKVTIDGIEKAKECVLRARGSLDSMFTSLMQLLYNRDILQKPEDKILYMWLCEDLGRFLGQLDDDEEHYIVTFDNLSKEDNRVGVSRVSAYVKRIKTSAETMIYDALFKATEEYSKLEKDSRTPRTFLYILFQILQITMSISGGLSRKSNQSKIVKRTPQSLFPVSYQALMSPQGGDLIKRGYQESTGNDISEIEDTILKLEEENGANIEYFKDEYTEGD